MEELAVVYFLSIDSQAISTLREKYDAHWRAIQPHITLVFPFSGVPEDLLLAHLETVVKDLKSFPIQLYGLTKSFDNYLFLLVKQGHEEILAVHDRLYTGVLASYLYKTIPFQPHITLGYFGVEPTRFNANLYKKAFEEANSMNLNFQCRFDNLTLIKGDGIQPAKILRSFLLE